MNKYLIQIPTVPFGLISTEIEGTAEQAVEEHQKLLSVYSERKSGVAQAGLPQKEWNQVFDSYINGNPLHPDTYYKMSDIQQKIIQAVKLSLKRIKAKSGEEVIDNDN